MTDMNACQLDPENAQGAYSIFVRCGAVTGTVTVTHEGTFAFTPESVSPGWGLSWCFSHTGYWVSGTVEEGTMVPLAKARALLANTCFGGGLEASG